MLIGHFPTSLEAQRIPFLCFIARPTTQIFPHNLWMMFTTFIYLKHVLFYKALIDSWRVMRGMSRVSQFANPNHRCMEGRRIIGGRRTRVHNPRIGQWTLKAGGIRSGSVLDSLFYVDTS